MSRFRFGMGLLYLTVLIQSACAPTYRPPATPPAGKSLLKINLLADDTQTARATAPTFNCSPSVIVCDVNRTHKPNSEFHWSPEHERMPSGRHIAYNRSYILEPGPQTLSVEWGINWCSSDSDVQKGAIVAGALIGGGLLIYAAERDQAPPQTMEFDAASDRSYILDCDTNHYPWVWVTPESER